VKNKFKESKNSYFTLNLKKKTRIFDFFKMKYEGYLSHLLFFLQPFESVLMTSNGVPRVDVSNTFRQVPTSKFWGEKFF
jgi:hypothetical protein